MSYPCGYDHTKKTTHDLRKLSNLACNASSSDTEAAGRLVLAGGAFPVLDCGGAPSLSPTATANRWFAIDSVVVPIVLGVSPSCSVMNDVRDEL
jgi:hypothetical protein